MIRAKQQHPTLELTKLATWLRLFIFLLFSGFIFYFLLKEPAGVVILYIYINVHLNFLSLYQSNLLPLEFQVIKKLDRFSAIIKLFISTLIFLF